MIATVLTISARPDRTADDLFRRFTKTSGVLQSYQLEAADNTPEIIVVTLWDSEQSRDSYLKGALKAELDRTYPRQARRTYRVRHAFGVGDVGEAVHGGAMPHAG